jgi:hypothetical protein
VVAGGRRRGKEDIKQNTLAPLILFIDFLTVKVACYKNKLLRHIALLNFSVFFVKNPR